MEFQKKLTQFISQLHKTIEGALSAGASKPAAAPAKKAATAPAPQARKRSKITCPICKGNGRWGTTADACFKCNASGFIHTYRYGQPRCKPCHGTGLKGGVRLEFCPKCDGVSLTPFAEDDQDHTLVAPRARSGR